DRGASLLATDPGLGRLLGARDSAALGHRLLLPVLGLPEGEWSPPPAATLGHGTVALVVLDGALLRGRADEDFRLLGPGAVLDPWNHPAVSWRACMPVRAAVIGEAFFQAVAPWPAAAARMLQRAGGDSDGLLVGGSDVAPVADRLGELMWRLAAH